MTYPRTDLGNAERLAYRYGQHLRWVADWKKWLVWDGTRWTSDTSAQSQVNRWAMETLLAIGREEAELAKDEDEAEQLRAWCLRSQSLSRLRATVSIARDLLAVSVSDLDDLPQEGGR